MSRKKKIDSPVIESEEVQAQPEPKEKKGRQSFGDILLEAQAKRKLKVYAKRK
jgi:hypothetical protein